jgi:hypothetical protein
LIALPSTQVPPERKRLHYAPSKSLTTRGRDGSASKTAWLDPRKRGVSSRMSLLHLARNKRIISVYRILVCCCGEVHRVLFSANITTPHVETGTDSEIGEQNTAQYFTSVDRQQDGYASDSSLGKSCGSSRKPRRQVSIGRKDLPQKLTSLRSVSGPYGNNRRTGGKQNCLRYRWRT